MASYRAGVEWTLLEGADFAAGRYSRGHTVVFEHQTLAGTASAQVVGSKWAAPGAVDPEEMLVASIAACHMLSFLHVARLEGFVVTGYRDAAVGVMEKTPAGRMAVTRVTLHPEIAYQGRRPTEAERDRMHHRAHEECFIANSVRTEITVEERSAA